MSNNLSDKKKQTLDKTRRGFIKTVAYTSVLTLGGLHSLAFARKSSVTLESTLGLSNKNGAVNNPDTLSNSGIRIIQETKFDREAVTLINESGKLQQLDARQPISLHQIMGKLIVTVNQNDIEAMNGMVLMSPNERFTFDVKAIGLDVSNTKTDLPMLTNLAENQLQISSHHSVFNRIVPVQLV